MKNKTTLTLVISILGSLLWGAAAITYLNSPEGILLLKTPIKDVPYGTILFTWVMIEGFKLWDTK